MSLGKSLSALPVREHREGIAAAAMLSMWRHRFLILGAVALSLAAAAGALAVIERRYVAEAIVQLDLQRPESSFGPDQALAVAIDVNALAQSEARILRSRGVARGAVSRLGLASDPRYADGPSALVQARAAIKPILAWVRGDAAHAVPYPSDPASDAAGPADGDTPEARAVRDVMGRLTVATDSRSYLITISYRSTDPVLAARIANAIAEEYLTRRREAVHEAARRRGEWLGAQIHDTIASLREAEARILAYRERTGMLESALETAGGPENVHQQQLRDVTTQLGAASLARLNEERRQARVQDLLRSGHLPSAADLQGSPLIATLAEREAAARRELEEQRSRFGARHPSVLERQAGIADLRSRMEAEVRRAVTVISGDVEAARRAEIDLGARLDGLKRALMKDKAQEAELRLLQTNARTLRERLVALARSHDQALDARDPRPVAASLVVPAEPDRAPAWPRPMVVLALGLVGGLGAGVSGAMMMERRDQGFRTSGDLPPGSAARCLAMVPELPPAARAAREAGLPENPGSAAFDEAIYSVGASIGLFGDPGGCRIVLVTSSVRGEGKSTLCQALARALSSAGQRVMLIDGAPTRGRNQTAAAPGEAGRPASPAAAPAERSGGTTLVTLQRNSSLPLTADVFSPGNLASALEEARKHFDVILIEGAPVMLVADSLVLGRLADVVVHVARWAHTKQRVVDAALRRLREHSIMVEGLVLARVDLRRHRRLRLLDECSFYVKEKRFYEHLAGRSKPRPAHPLART